MQTFAGETKEALSERTWPLHLTWEEWGEGEKGGL